MIKFSFHKFKQIVTNICNNFSFMIHLQPFSKIDFERLISWVRTEKELIQFAGPIFSFPLTIKQLENYLASELREIFTIILNETGEAIGHCEFNFENDIPRISRVLIGNEQSRNRGVGTAVIRTMSAELFSNPVHTKIDLNVFAWNDRAIHCYEKLGFRIHKTTDFDQPIDGQIWENHNMVLTRENYALFQR